MNILYIANSLAMYGANRSMIEMIVKIRKYGHTPYILLSSDGEVCRELRRLRIEYGVVGYEVSAHQENTLNPKQKFDILEKNIKLLPAIKEYIDRWNIDIIHSNASNINIGALASLRYKIPHVWHVRELLYEDYYLRNDFPRLDRWLMNRANKVIAISNYVKNMRHLDNKNVIAIHDGLGIDMYSQTREKDLFENDTINLLYCGAVMTSKGVMDVVKAVNILVHRYNQKVKLIVAGSKGEIYPEMIKFIRSKGLSENVKCLGHCTDLTGLRQQADIVVVCSRNEGLGRVSVEAMLSEDVLVGARAGGTAEIVQDGVTGFLYRVGDAYQLARVIMKAKRNPDKCMQLISKAKEYAVKEFDSEAYALKIIEIYKEVLR